MRAAAGGGSSLFERSCLYRSGLNTMGSIVRVVLTFLYCRMVSNITVTFDGRALNPEFPLDLQPNRRYRITLIEEEPRSGLGDVVERMERLNALAGSIVLRQDPMDDQVRERDAW